MRRVFGGYQSGSSNKTEEGNILVSFFDTNSKFISRSDIGYKNTGKGWTHLEQIVKVPPKTRLIQYNFLVKKAKGSKEGAYLDDAYLYMTKNFDKTSPSVTATIKKEEINFYSSPDLSKIMYVQIDKVIVKDSLTKKIIFEKPFTCDTTKQAALQSYFSSNNTIKVYCQKKSSRDLHIINFTNSDEYSYTGNTNPGTAIYLDDKHFIVDSGYSKKAKLVNIENKKTLCTFKFFIHRSAKKMMKPYTFKLIFFIEFFYF